jgi:integrase
MRIAVQVLDKDNIRVNTFLDSIGRNSHNSKKLYRTGLNHFADFLRSEKQTPDTIISQIKSEKINTYELLDQFVSYLSKQAVAATSLKSYIAVIRSYLEYNDIDISNAKFKRKVKMPKTYPDQEEPLSLTDIRELLEYNSNHRLRAFILLLTSSGMRAMEACSLRLQDVDFTSAPTKITIRREYSKTKRIRTIYCSDEATKHFHKLIEMNSSRQPQDLIFALEDGKIPASIYTRLLEQFQKLQRIADKNQRKENSLRRKITLHSFRRTAYSIIGEQTNTDYANWFLGHHHSVYWTHKETERCSIYRTKCMPFLTVYQETRDNSIEAALREKDQTIKLLTNRIADIELHQKETSEILRHLTPEKLQKITNS